MKLVFSQKRAENSYKDYVGDFTDRTNFCLQVKWFINTNLVLENYYEFPIVENQIQWLFTTARENEMRDFFNRALKLIVFG